MRYEIKWVIGTILTIIIVLSTIGFFNSPNIIRIRQIGYDSTCPNTLIPSSFEVSFINQGNKEANPLYVNIWSEDPNITFVKNSDYLYLSPGSTAQFKLILNQSSINNLNLTINYGWHYNKHFFQLENHSVSCYYNREYYYSNFNLISEKLKS
ncbi:MAG: hypothetical protein WC796_01905 [Candidatus Pacearchaeota archaeon]|jgi:hypothetical protein